MTVAHRMLLQTLAGHFAWLKEAHPQKAASPAARRASRSVQLKLRATTPGKKAA
jgi:hypothetical protein